MDINKKLILYDNERNPNAFNFDSLTCRPLESLLNPLDIQYLNKIAKSLKYNGNIKLKYQKMDDLLRKRGFVKYACGTNRRVYRYLDDNSFVLKVAVDKVGLSDNPNEYINQQYLKPFVSKMYQMSPCGTVSICERVEPIRTRDEYITYAGDIFDMLYMKVLGKYILEDIGDSAFMNYGVRKGFGPVLLDFPYMYEVELNNLKCKRVINGHVCNGLIDYDNCFNRLVCKNCGHEYTGKELGHKVGFKQSSNKLIIEDCDYTNKARFKITDMDGKVLVDSTRRQSEIIF